jgi:hypothetical protein
VTRPDGSGPPACGAPGTAGGHASGTWLRDVACDSPGTRRGGGGGTASVARDTALHERQPGKRAGPARPVQCKRRALRVAYILLHWAVCERAVPGVCWYRVTARVCARMRACARVCARARVRARDVDGYTRMLEFSHALLSSCLRIVISSHDKVHYRGCSH